MVSKRIECRPLPAGDLVFTWTFVGVILWVRTKAELKEAEGSMRLSVCEMERAKG